MTEKVVDKKKKVPDGLNPKELSVIGEIFYNGVQKNEQTPNSRIF